MNPKLCVFDVEVSPILGWAYQLYDTNLIHVERDQHMMSWSAKVGRKITTRTLPDYELYKKEPYNDRELVKEFHQLINENDLYVGHNLDRFDIRITQARMLEHGFSPPSPLRTVDTLKIARKHFKFSSNKLGDLAERLGVGKKTYEKHSDLWRDCLSGDMKAWEKLRRYNKRDVVLTDRVYLKLRPWIQNHTPLSNNPLKCPNCGEKNLQKRGTYITRKSKLQRLCCQSCGAWTKGDKII